MWNLNIKKIMNNLNGLRMRVLVIEFMMNDYDVIFYNVEYKMCGYILYLFKLEKYLYY